MFIQRFITKLKGKLFGDKGYISAKLTELFFVDGIQLITSIKKKI
ncbi:MAG: transposase [Bacteroidetes bacterium]|nr:transposase [Bacteroidota bacterium]